MTQQVLPEQEQKTPRFIVRRLPEVRQQMDWGLEQWYDVQWEVWDTQEQRRIDGQTFSPYFADEETAQGCADNWNFVVGPPAHCGSCKKELAEGESRFGGGYFAVVCYSCSAATED